MSKKKNYQAMVDYHRRLNADLTIGAFRVAPELAKEFGVMQIDEQQRIVGFQEKPKVPLTIPGDCSHCLASMGIYIFSARFLLEQLCRDPGDIRSQRDFGKNIIPSVIQSHRVFAFPFRDENGKTDSYWRDVGTMDAYYEANMDLIAVDPLLNLHDSAWPIRTYQANLPPSKIVFGSQAEGDRVGAALDSIVCGGTIISRGSVLRSIVGPRVRVNSFSFVEDSILFEGVDIGRHCRVRRAIIDKGVKLPQGTEIGFDLKHDLQRGFFVSEKGIVIIPKNDSIDSRTNPCDEMDRPSDD